MSTKEYHKEYYKKHPEKWPWLKDKTLAKSRKLKHYYGITLEQYDILLQSQNNKCAICGSKYSDGKMLAVDHCHKTMKVRGLLCRRCNSTLGWLEENTNLMQSMIDYVIKHNS